MSPGSRLKERKRNETKRLTRPGQRDIPALVTGSSSAISFISVEGGQLFGGAVMRLSSGY